MAQRVQVLLVCDLHDDETAGDETVSFSLDGTNYEIDLCSRHAAELREGLAGYVARARRAGGVAGRTGARRRASRPRDGRADTADVRAWARGQGLQVSERGRIPADVIAQYEAAR
jgi:hypothetical protein